MDATNILRHISFYSFYATTPYRSDLQLIELMWASTRGNIGRSYSLGTTLQVVREKLKNEYPEIDFRAGEAIINGII